MITLSADLGEGSPREEEVWPLIDRANIACGGHVGDEYSMREAARLAREHDVITGAHPSYPDREHFGRRSIAIEPSLLREALVTQLQTLRAICEVRHVKPHGALYNDAHADPALAAVIVDAIIEVDASMALVAPDHSQMASAARRRGIAVIREAFADRRYTADRTLVPRSIPGSTLNVDEAIAQATLLATEGVVLAIDGTRVPIAFDTLCVHADMDGAVERLEGLRALHR